MSDKIIEELETQLRQQLLILGDCRPYVMNGLTTSVAAVKLGKRIDAALAAPPEAKEQAR
jgi:hypothetical protein